MKNPALKKPPQLPVVSFLPLFPLTFILFGYTATGISSRVLLFLTTTTAGGLFYA